MEKIIEITKKKWMIMFKEQSIPESIFPNRDLQERQLNFFELYEGEGQVILSNLKKAIDPFNENFTILNY